MCLLALRNAYLLLYIAASVNEREVLDGDNVNINCPASGTVEWYYLQDLNDTAEHALEIFQNINILFDGDLSISGVSPSHEGYYYCTVNDAPQTPTLLVVLGELVY